MKKLLVVAVILAVAAIFVNDLGAYVNTRRNLVEATRDAAEAAAVTDGGRDTAARAAADRAAEQGVEVYLYDQDGTRVQVWTRAPLEGTLVYAPVVALVGGTALDATPMLEHFETQPIR